VLNGGIQLRNRSVEPCPLHRQHAMHLFEGFVRGFQKFRVDRPQSGQFPHGIVHDVRAHFGTSCTVTTWLKYNRRPQHGISVGVSG